MTCQKRKGYITFFLKEKVLDLGFIDVCNYPSFGLRTRLLITTTKLKCNSPFYI